MRTLFFFFFHYLLYVLQVVLWFLPTNFHFVPQVHAQTVPSIVINEVLPAPSSGNDWVEVKNVSGGTVSLSGWSLEDSSSALTPVPTMSSVAVPADGYAVFEVSNRLNNSGDQVKLKDATGQIVDLFSYSSSVSDQSWARTPDGTGGFALANPTRGSSNTPVASASPSPVSSPLPSPSASPSASPAASPSPSPSVIPSLSPTPSPSSNPTPSPSPSPLPSPTPTYPDNLQLSEIYACPDTGEEEWIEIYNPNATSYDLTNWKIKDNLNNSRIVNATVPAQNFAVLSWTTGILNNTGDSVSLERPDGARLFTVPFGECQKGQSFIFYGGIWQLTATVTKGAQNIFEFPDSSDTTTDVTSDPSPSPTSYQNVLATEAVDAAPDTLPLPDSTLDPNKILGLSMSDNPDPPVDQFNASASAQLQESSFFPSASSSATPSAAANSAGTTFGTMGAASADKTPLAPLTKKPPSSSSSPIFLIGVFLLICGFLICSMISAYLIYHWYIAQKTEDKLNFM